MVTITKADGSSLGTATYTSGTIYTWTNVTGGSVALGSTDPIWLKVVDSTKSYANYYYQVLVFTGDAQWTAWKTQSQSVTLL